jgi:hypothetical protein
MRFLAWNCRGLSRASAVRSLRGKIRNHSPDVLFLSETKMHPNNAVVILNSLGYFHMLHAPPSGSKGGLLLAWRHGVDIECISSSVNIINVWCYSDPVHSPWLLSCIYGPPEAQNKPAFWNSLLDVGLGFKGRQRITLSETSSRFKMTKWAAIEQYRERRGANA